VSLKKLFDNLEEYVLMVLFPIMVVVVFVATMVRYLTNFPLPWSSEVARYVMVWLAYIGASLGIKKNAHLGVEIVVSLLPDVLKKFFGYIRTAMIILFNVLVIYFTFQIIQNQIATEQLSPALRIPIYWAYLAIPAGAFLMIIRSIQVLFVPVEEE